MNKLKEFRDKTGVNGHEFARTVKLSAPTIHNIENGKKNPSLKTAYKIVNAINLLGVPCSIVDIFPPEDLKQAS